MLPSILLAATTLFSTSLTSPINPRQSNGNNNQLNVTDARYDGQCFYPEADDDFELNDYLGRWYQVAGTVAPFTAGCKCVYAEYSLNANGTVRVFNGCEANGRAINIEGTATIVPEALGYGEEGVFRVQFPGQPAPECPGPNYIVQDVDDADDNDGFALVQSSNFTTLFVLSRQQNPSASRIERWIDRAGRRGSDLSNVVLTDQTGCQFT